MASDHVAGRDGFLIIEVRGNGIVERPLSLEDCKMSCDVGRSFILSIVTHDYLFIVLWRKASLGTVTIANQRDRFWMTGMYRPGGLKIWRQDSHEVNDDG